MGFRTVVILYNDQSSEWVNDPLLGQKIACGSFDAMSLKGVSSDPSSKAHLGFGTVVQCTHADTQTVGIIDSYRFLPVAHSFWRPSDTDILLKERLLREWADEMGFKLVRKKK